MGPAGHRLPDHGRLRSDSSESFGTWVLVCKGQRPLGQDILLSTKTGRNSHAEARRAHAMDTSQGSCHQDLFCPKNCALPSPRTQYQAPKSSSVRAAQPGIFRVLGGRRLDLTERASEVQSHDALCLCQEPGSLRRPLILSVSAPLWRHDINLFLKSITAQVSKV